MCMRTNIDLDEELVREAQLLTGITTKKGMVHEALRMLIAERRRQRLPLSDLRGKIKFAPDWDYKADRARD